VTCDTFQNHHYAIYIDDSAKVSDFGTLGGTSRGVGNDFLLMGVHNISKWVYNKNTTLSGTLKYVQINQSSADPGFFYQVAWTAPLPPASDYCSSIDACKNWPLKIENNVLLQSTIKVYPNPANDQLILDFSNDRIVYKDLKIEIFDIIGRRIFSQSIVNDTRLVQVNTTSYTSGVYLYRIATDQNSQKIGKFEIRH
jgi:hypothetical protein